MNTRDSKRILDVTVVREVDTDPQFEGEYSDTPEDFAIVAIGSHKGEFADSLPCECDHAESEHKEDDEGYLACSAMIAGAFNSKPCGCQEFDRVAIERGREYRYFNAPVDNYQGEPDEDIRKYAMQDYQRMEDYNNQQWCFLGVSARARVQVNGDTVQTIRSGSLWGIESDSDDAYLTEVETEQLAELKTQLHAIGFTKRAISAAMREVKHKDE